VRKIIFINILSLCIIKTSFAQKITFNGYIKEKNTQEHIVGASIFIPNLKVGIQSNNYGFYSLTIEQKDSLELHISMIGYKPEILKISANRNQTIVIYPQLP